MNDVMRPRSKVAISIFLLCVFVIPSSTSSTTKLDAATLKSSEIPKECREVDGKYPTDIQTAILYDRYDVYKGTLPSLSGKQAQSFKCGREKGTIFYFEYHNAADRENAERFIRRLLWGEDHPNADHPEQIEHADNLLLVIAFQKIPDTLLAAIHSKLQSKG